MQRKLAAILHKSWTQAPHCTVFGDVDVTQLCALRASLKRDDAQAPTVSHFVLVALARALAQHPRLNAHLEGDVLTRHAAIDLGLAIALENGGLLAPVLRDAGGLDAHQMATLARDRAALAHAGRLKPADMQGAGFTFSSAGRSRTPRYATPILPLPQVAILAATAIRRMPVVSGDGIVAADILPLSLTFDHRALNGEQANVFLDCLADHLAAPDAFLVPLPEKEPT